VKYELFLAFRYLGGLRRSQPFVSVIAAISILGIALGVAALLVVLGVMSGFDADLEAKIVGSNPHLTVEADGGIDQAELLIQKIKAISGVTAAAPFIQTQVLVRRTEEGFGVLLRGIDPVRESKVTGLEQAIQQGAWPPEEGHLIIGSELARRWGLRLGDSVDVVAGQKGKPHALKVGAIFTTGMYEYDLHLTLCTLATAQQILGVEGTVSGIGVRLQRAIQARTMKRTIQRKLGYPHWVTSWMDRNKNLFAALKLEKTTMFVILTLIVLVACFNIVATLLTLVVQKTKEIGILRSVGATGRSIRRIFIWAGLTLGALGTTLGVLVGLGLCLALSQYQFVQLPPEIYYIDHLPVKLEWVDVLTVMAAALGISLGACLYPAWLASRLNPAQALRYE